MSTRPSHCRIVSASHGPMKIGIGHVRFILVARVVFAPNQRQDRKRGRLHLIVYLAHRAANHLRARNRFLRAEDVLRRIVSVDVSRNEIHGNVIFRPCGE